MGKGGGRRGRGWLSCMPLVVKLAQLPAPPPLCATLPLPWACCPSPSLEQSPPFLQRPAPMPPPPPRTASHTVLAAHFLPPYGFGAPLPPPSLVDSEPCVC